MNNKEIVSKVREFNRFYMPKMNLLGNHYLGSEYSVTEARVFFEIYENEGCHAAHIAKVMNIDKSYLSKIIVKYEKEGYVQRISSCEDRRSYELYLTQKGKDKVRKLIYQSEKEIESTLQHLSIEEQDLMNEALNTVIKLLKKGELYNENCTLSSKI